MPNLSYLQKEGTMRPSQYRYFAVLFLAFILTSLTLLPVYSAPNYATAKFKQLWEYSDKLVDEQPGAGRGYTWGPNTFGAFSEEYQEGSNGRRLVQYFDKSRMELSANGQLVTNGLLTKELVTGLRQDGDNRFIQLNPSTIQVAGDDNSNGNAVAPTYASFKGVVTFQPGENTAPDRTGQSINQAIAKDGTVTTLDKPPANITIATYEGTLGHNIPSVFQDFQNLNGKVWTGVNYVAGKVYTVNPIANVFGYPIAEAFWARAVVAGQEKDVLIQLYERRVLTYTPSNPDGFKVEMGNIGQHYYHWRYLQNIPAPISLTGSGNKVVKGVNVSAGIARMTSFHDGKKNFAAKVLDPTGKTVGFPVNTIGVYQGNTFIEVPQSGSYALEVTADGNWKVDIQDMLSLRQEPPQPGASFKGKGDVTLKFTPPQVGLNVFHLAYSGPRNFAVVAYDSNGRNVATIANEIGNYTGEKAFSALAGDYYLTIRSSGDWSIDIG